MHPLNKGDRLHRAKQLKHNRKSYYGYNRTYGTEGVRAMTPTQLGKVSQYPAVCSCYMCSGNCYRKVYGNSLRGKTVQELKQLSYSNSF